ncbi:uncharacterized protein SPSK_03764 [Sporothrix schenckii 1099-18]|uniref:Uncharacterized protein n=1 Tax=Sporothrix schenckii 1099-18 TaxID=1397361 RepID=A0A0F2LYX2_SPOSC|nr:uncharacterized protein SPSK_03764 [Sporothrix schenckii 1099-18]KJR82667.1 hypothetical protein SPSK_03764 [Sporothrix schenckii 1099-18]
MRPTFWTLSQSHTCSGVETRTTIFCRNPKTSQFSITKRIFVSWQNRRIYINHQRSPTPSTNRQNENLRRYVRDFDSRNFVREEEVRMLGEAG